MVNPDYGAVEAEGAEGPFSSVPSTPYEQPNSYEGRDRVFGIRRSNVLIALSAVAFTAAALSLNALPKGGGSTVADMAVDTTAVEMQPEPNAMSGRVGNHLGGAAGASVKAGKVPVGTPRSSSMTSKSADAPNVLLIVVDQARPDAFGVYGNTVSYTPTFDKIANDGVRFAQAYTSTPICTPARQSLLTGLKPWNHGMRCYANQVTPTKWTGGWLELPTVMNDLGYYTASVGKNHYGYNSTTMEWFTHGFDQFYPYEGDLSEDDEIKSKFEILDSYGLYFNETCPNCDPLATVPVDDVNAWYGGVYIYNESWHPTAWTGRTAIEWLEWWNSDGSDDYDDTTPFLLKLSFQRPHSPYDPPLDYLKFILDRAGDDLYKIDDARKGDSGEWDYTFSSEAAPTLCNMSNSDTYCGDTSSYNVRNSRAHYYASLYFVDHWAGKVLDKFTEFGYLESSLVVFVADHGDSLGDHNLWRKGYPTQQVATVPMFLRWPSSMDSLVGVDRGYVSTKLTELRDILPTIADFAGKNITEEVDGSSLLDLVRSPETSDWRTFIDMELTSCGFNETLTFNALTDGEVKYVYWWYEGIENIFNLTADPYETTDLRPSEPELANVWRAKMVAMFEEEGRDEYWVKNGTLQTQKTCWKFDYMPNYPCWVDEIYTFVCSTE